ncbi:MAG TPA: S46 family peptidase [Tepidisphaeraceae bacterium]|jgi:hypothetical protein|nr:S46 family peptidase [Tepidisphaeraceae bacterium]
MKHVLGMVVWCALVAVLLPYGCAQRAGESKAQPAAALPPEQANILPTEGMWLPNALPVSRLRRDFNFAPTQAWADHLRLSSVRIGASGSFVSADGLILTNHHVASEGLQNISKDGKDYVANGFLAKTRDQEIQLPGEQIEVLESIEDVTARVNAAVDAKLSPDEAVKARHAVFAEIERESLEKTGLHSNVVTLYGGALYHLYRYKRYNDIRAVFAPEVSSAFFGGDPDNFEYPRFCLDIALLRAYENGKPAHVENYLKFSTKGVADGDLVFVSGHPGRTDRLLPVSMLTTMRDFTLPLHIEQLERRERALMDYSARSDEAKRQAQEEIFYIQNSLKASRPRLAALKQGVIEQKQREEDLLRSRLREHEDLQHFDSAWGRIAAAEKESKKHALERYFVADGNAFSWQFFGNTRHLVRAAAEDAKPDGERLPEFTKSKRQAMEDDLFADYPFYPDLEIAEMTTTLQIFKDKLGSDSPMVQKVLMGKEPAARAKELVKGSKLGSAAERRRIYKGGAAAIASSTDSMIELARLVDDDARALRREYEAKVQEPETEALGEINRARFALMGSNDYPDATGTLRLALGVVKGYEQDGQTIAPWMTMGGAFEHEKQHGAAPPFALPKSWADAKAKLDLDVPLNFVCTADIIGGNSGSPVVNRAGEFVGVIFDSNRQGIVDNFTYSDVKRRAVAVDSRGILEAMKKIYGADALVEELTGTGSK